MLSPKQSRQTGGENTNAAYDNKELAKSLAIFKPKRLRCCSRSGFCVGSIHQVHSASSVQEYPVAKCVQTPDDPQPTLFTGYHPSGLFSLTVLGQLQEELGGDHADHCMITMVDATNIVLFTKIPGLLPIELREFTRWEKSEISINPFKTLTVYGKAAFVSSKLLYPHKFMSLS